jgi:hypothetical protein
MKPTTAPVVVPTDNSDAAFQALLQSHNYAPPAQTSTGGWYDKLKGTSEPAMPAEPNILQKTGSSIVDTAKAGIENVKSGISDLYTPPDATMDTQPKNPNAIGSGPVSTALEIGAKAIKGGEKAVGGLGKVVGGVAQTALSPVLGPVSAVGGAIGEKIGNAVPSDAAMKFEDMLKAHPAIGENASDIMNMANLAFPEAMKAATPAIDATSAAIKDTAGNIKESLTPKAPTPEEIAASKAQDVATQKDTAQATALKAHDIVDKEVRNTAEKYPTVGKALNNAEVTRGTEPIKVMSSYPEGKALPSMTSGGKMNSIPAINFLKTQISTLGKIKENLVGTTKENTSVEDFKQAAFDRIDKGNASLAKKTADKADVGKIIDGLGTTYPEGIPSTELDKIKTEQANESKSYNSKSPFSADSHAIVGQTAADAVVTKGGDAPIDELNKLLSSHYDAVKVLTAMNGKTPHGGMFSRHMGGIAGEVAGLAGGMAVGHPFIGAMIGRGASEFVNNILSSHFISNPLKATLIKNTPGLEPEVVQKALDYIDASEGSPTQTPTESTPRPSPKVPETTSK